jgi:hypothetical protein
MSEDFLSRWSRRKREVAKAEREPVQPEAQAPEQAPEAPAAADESQKPDEVDLAGLPSLEEITESTDISGFLRRGVPEELTRSALRKVWSSDPAIRDFVGLSENAWDFNDPTAIPGFGPLDFSPEQVRQMAAKLVGDVQDASEKIERVAASAAQQEPSIPEAPQLEKPAEKAPRASIAPQQVENPAPGERPEESSLPPRRHGSALPR